MIDDSDSNDSNGWSSPQDDSPVSGFMTAYGGVDITSDKTAISPEGGRKSDTKKVSTKNDLKESERTKTTFLSH